MKNTPLLYLLIVFSITTGLSFIFSTEDAGGEGGGTTFEFGRTTSAGCENQPNMSCAPPSSSSGGAESRSAGGSDNSRFYKNRDNELVLEFYKKDLPDYVREQQFKDKIFRLDSSFIIVDTRLLNYLGEEKDTLTVEAGEYPVKETLGSFKVTFTPDQNRKKWKKEKAEGSSRS